jgi:Poly(ADP-ribose) polymerase and DNA-Ligase Zn-finger region
MADIIEASKSNRATCRTCRLKIDKGVLRFGEETVNAFSSEGELTHQWHHLECAAGRMAAKVKVALAAFTGPVPDREKLEAILATPPKASGKGGAKATFPYAERASTGRSKCMACDEAIEKGAMRIALEREVDTGSFTTKGPGYLHPACAREHTGNDKLLEEISANIALPPEDLAALTAEF